MPIKGMTDRDSLKPRWPIIGNLRKGGEKTNPKKPGADLDYFRFTSDNPEIEAAFREAFGAQPKTLTVMLPYATLNENFSTWIEWWKASALQFRSDGENCVLWLDAKTGTYRHDPKPYDPGMGGKEVGRLSVIIPELLNVSRKVGVVSLATTSKNDILSIANTLAMVEQEQRQHGRDLAKMLFTLRRVPEMVSVPAFGKDAAPGDRQRVQKYLVKIEPTAAWAAAQLALATDTVAALPPAAERHALTVDGRDVDPTTGEVLDGDFTPEPPAPPTPAPVALTLEQARAHTVPGGSEAGVPFGECSTDFLRKVAEYAKSTPETVAAARAVLASRPQPKSAPELRAECEATWKTMTPDERDFMGAFGDGLDPDKMALWLAKLDGLRQSAARAAERAAEGGQ